ncbi:hypothetical protein [Paracoccus aminophilus]|nr:hypothetical protein [Paracoccus aminophilus]
MIRHAPNRTAESGLTLSDLIAAMARRLVATCAFNMIDAAAYVIDLMQSLSEEFGSPHYDWSLEGAWEMIREDRGSWDRDDCEDEANP